MGLIKQQLLQEIELIPEEKLVDLYHLLHDFRVGLQKEESTHSAQTLSFAGCWADMPEAIFTDLMDDLASRRSQAFVGRRERESLSH